jgi:hypothetical protein
MYYHRIKELCITLVIETSLYYDARSEKHQIICLCLVYLTISLQDEWLILHLVLFLQ